MPSPTDTRPLAGIRVLELGQLIAGPFAACVLGYFGAEVIKVEPPGKGDALRNWRVLDDDGTSFWWRSMARNKRCVTINLREERGRELVHELAMGSDVLLENFRPGTMEKWGLGPERYQQQRAQLIYTRLSGYGQSGPYSSRPGFASACEGFGGFRYINGFPDEAPVRPNLSMGDTLAAMNAVIGILMALIGRNRLGGSGQVVDVAIYESVFNMLESVVPEFDGAGVVREPSGTTLTGIVPTNTYRCADGRYIVIGGNGDSIFKRLMQVAGRTDLADDPRLADNAGRVQHQTEVDEAISAWTGSLSADEVLTRLDAAAVPNGPINSVREMMEDPHFQARGMFETVQVGAGTLKIPALTPRLCSTPGRTDFAGPELGAHNDEVFREILGLTAAQIQQLGEAGVI